MLASGMGWNLEEHTTFDQFDPQIPNINHYCCGSRSCSCLGESGCRDEDGDTVNVTPSVISWPPPATVLEAAGSYRDVKVTVGSDQSMPLLSSDKMVVKKLNHNAGERDRRRKINDLFSSLRSLLPQTNQTKLSIPAMVSHAIKYIPELKKEVNELMQRKEELLSRFISKKTENLSFHGKGKISTSSTAQGSTPRCSVQATQISNEQIMIQISTLKFMGQPAMPFSDVLRMIEEEEDGLQVIDISSFNSFGGRVFYSIHLLMEEAQRTIRCELLSEKLLSCHQKWDTLCRWTS